MREFLDSMIKSQSVPVPHFINVTNDILHLAEITLSDVMAKSINKYLMDTRGNHRERNVDPHSYLGTKNIQEVILDSCIWNDQSAASILHGMKDHKSIDSLTMCNCKLGP